MEQLKKTFLVLRAGLQQTFTDRKVIILLVLLGFILDNGIRPLVHNAMEVGQPIGIFEGFIMCTNHWYYLIVLLVGFIFLLTGIPRLDSGQLLIIYRTGKKNWLFGEILQIAVSAVIYIMLLLAGCMISTFKYAYIGNVWSNYTINYELVYKDMLSDKYHFIDQQVFKYYMPYQSVLHGILLLVLCMTLMGTIVLFFSIIEKKLVGIILNVISIFFVLVFYEYRAWIMWISPFCHAVLLSHNVFVYRRLSLPLAYSYLYLALLEGIIIALSLKKLRKRMFY